MNDNVSVTYSPDTGITSLSIAEFCRLEQVYQESVRDSADNNDIAQMIATAKSGKSAFNYVYDVCPYVTIDGTELDIELDFYVWPYDMELDYTLSTAIGTIENKRIIKEARSFDVPFRGSSTASLQYLFFGKVTPEMPVFSVKGEELDDKYLVVEDTYLSYPVAITSVFRASGSVSGHRYTLKMVLDKASGGPSIILVPSYATILQYTAGGELDFSKIVHRSGAVGAAYRLTFINTEIFNVYKDDDEFVSAGNRTRDYSNKYFYLPASAWSGDWDRDDYAGFTVEETINEVDVSGYKIENLQADIIARWVDSEGNDQESVLDVKIPPCVQDLLTECPDGDPPIFDIGGSIGGGENEEDSGVAYYNTCSGELL